MQHHKNEIQIQTETMLQSCLNSMELWKKIQHSYSKWLDHLEMGSRWNESSFGFVIKPPNACAIVVGWATKSSNRYTWPFRSETWRFLTEKYWLKERMNEKICSIRDEKDKPRMNSLNTQHNPTKQMRTRMEWEKKSRQKRNERKKKNQKTNRDWNLRLSWPPQHQGLHAIISLMWYVRIVLYCCNHKALYSVCFVWRFYFSLFFVFARDFLFFIFTSMFVHSFAVSLSHTNHHLNICITDTIRTRRHQLYSKSKLAFHSIGVFFFFIFFLRFRLCWRCSHTCVLIRVRFAVYAAHLKSGLFWNCAGLYCYVFAVDTIYWPQIVQKSNKARSTIIVSIWIWIWRHKFPNDDNIRKFIFFLCEC